jgi:hypothetical protein
MNPQLYHGTNAYAWHSIQWPQFEKISQCCQQLIILPIYSITDWGMGYPLDAEEVVGSCILDETLCMSASNFRPLVLPALRYTPRQALNTCFGLDIEHAHRLLTETVCSAAASGFSRFVLYNTCPLLEEWIDVAARDLRINYDLQMFCLNLSGLGLDFHPLRGGKRSGLNALLNEVLGQVIDEHYVSNCNSLMFDPILNNLVKTSSPIEVQDIGDTSVLHFVANRMLLLLNEIQSHPLLNEKTPNPMEDA